MGSIITFRWTPISRTLLIVSVSSIAVRYQSACVVILFPKCPKKWAQSSGSVAFDGQWQKKWKRILYDGGPYQKDLTRVFGALLVPSSVYVGKWLTIKLINSTYLCSRTCRSYSNIYKQESHHWSVSWFIVLNITIQTYKTTYHDQIQTFI